MVRGVYGAWVFEAWGLLRYADFWTPGKTPALFHQRR